MAKKHKAPTQVTIHQEEKGAFAQWIDTNWKMLAFAAVLISGLIMGRVFMNQQKESSEDVIHEEFQVAMLSGDAQTLKSASSDMTGTGYAGFPDLMAFQVAMREQRYDDAKAHLADLESNPSPLLDGLSYPVGPDGENRTAIEQAQEAWKGHQAQLAAFAKPELPEGSPKVRIETSMGNIEVGLFEELSPRHVENFLKNVEDGSYEGTRFHRVMDGFMIQGGDPNTKEEDRTKWGLGPEDATTVESEHDNGLIHWPYVLAAAKKPGQRDSSQFQFYITLGTPHHLNGVHTVYGVVTGGIDVVDDIAKIPVEDTAPIDAPTIKKVVVEE